VAVFGVERDDLTVECVDDDLAITIGHATIDKVATRHGDREWVLFRRVLPLRVIVVEIDGKDVIGIRRFEIHRIADHERLALMAACRAGRHRPGDFQVFRVLGRDFVQRRVACIGIIKTGHHPLGAILAHACERDFLLRRTRSQHAHYAERESAHRGNADI